MSGEDNEGVDDDRTLVEVMKGKRTRTSQEGMSSPGGDLLPSHPKNRESETQGECLAR
jgi:hypothetical protein